MNASKNKRSALSLLKEPAVWSFLCLFIAWFYFFWATIYPIYLFNSDTPWVSLVTYAITFLAILIVILRREVFYQAIFSSSQLALFVFFLLIVGYLLGNVFHLAYIEKISVLLMVPALLLIAFGRELTKELLVIPLLYWLLIIPIQDKDFEFRVILAIVAAFIGIGYIIYLKFYKPPLDFQRPFWVATNRRWMIPTGLGFVLIMSTPWLAENIRDFYPARKIVIELNAPLVQDGWQGPYRIVGQTLTPIFPNASATVHVEYLPDLKTDPTLEPVFLYSAYFHSDKSFREMFIPGDSVYDENVWKKFNSDVKIVSYGNDPAFKVNELVLINDSVKCLVWSWYYVAGYSTIDLVTADLLDRVRQISKYAQGSGVVVLSTNFATTEDNARERLQSFLDAVGQSLDVVKRPEIHYVTNPIHWGK